MLKERYYKLIYYHVVIILNSVIKDLKFITYQLSALQFQSIYQDFYNHYEETSSM